MLQAKKTVFYNAKITTLVDECPNAEAVCVFNDKIEAIGTKQEILDYVKNTSHDLIDCGGKFLYPGFIDTHSHLTMYSKMIDYAFCGAPCSQISEVLEKLSLKAKNQKKGEWIIGYSYDDTAMAESRHLFKQDLDSISTEHPILVYHISGHMGYVNSCAIEKLGITKDSQVEGGEYAKDEQGEINGFLVEFAFFEATAALPNPSLEQLQANIKKAVAEYNSYGITTFLDGGLGIGGSWKNCVKSLLELERKDELTARAYMQFMPEDMQKMAELGLYDCGSAYVKFGGLKYFTDGSIQGFTAALSEDYYSRPGFKSEILFPIADIDKIIADYHCQNIQIAVHTNGDAASEAVIQAFEKAYEKNPRADLAHMLIHAQMVSDEHLTRMKKLGIIPSFFTRHIEVWGDRHATIFIGPDRVARLNPAGSAVRLNMPFGMHVDTPVLPVMVLGNMHVGVNRISSGGNVYGEDQRITPLEALKAYTSYAALCCGTKALRGSLAVGNYADFVLLDQDLLSENTLGIKDIKILKTICGGKVVYSA